MGVNFKVIISTTKHTKTVGKLRWESMFLLQLDTSLKSKTTACEI